jgi:alkanesulfonate monooxygenase SsuD/methylene tetrahydromethanopterin reductase-like flavin-dependent oxidoreductase (luciferase family)
MQNMDYGFAFLSAVDIHKDVALAERKGFTHGWLYDNQMICADVFQCLALCAAKTKKIKLGTNVTNPLSRIAPVTANNFATLNLLAPGRAIMGIGTGNRPGAHLECRRRNSRNCASTWISVAACLADRRCPMRKPADGG